MTDPKPESPWLRARRLLKTLRKAPYPKRWHAARAELIQALDEIGDGMSKTSESNWDVDHDGRPDDNRPTTNNGETEHERTED